MREKKELGGGTRARGVDKESDDKLEKRAREERGPKEEDKKGSDIAKIPGL